MRVVISPDKTQGHVIQKYHFKVIPTVRHAEDTEHEPGGEGEEEQALAAPQPAEEKPSSMKDEALEQMLKKADELSTNLVKMQMQMEKQQEEFEKRLAETKEAALEEGRTLGFQESEKERADEMDALRSRIANAVEALVQSQQKFDTKLATIEEELIETALDLAGEVIAAEVGVRSKETALRLSKLLMGELKEASRVTLKANPEDAAYLREQLGTEKKVQIIDDLAIGKGGIVLMSDIGNIDGEIMHRFERIKEAVFPAAEES